MIETYDISQRRACRLVSVDPKTVRRKAERDNPDIRTRMREIAATRRRFGYRRIGIMLEREGIVMNQKKLRRLYREEGLAVKRRRGRKRATGTREPMPVPDAPSKRWSLDFVSDVFGPARRFRMLNVIDDYTRECLALVADTSLSGARVVRELDRCIRLYGRPETIVSDNGGLSSPSVAHLALRAKRDLNLFGRALPRDSVIILDEITDLIGTPGIDENLNTSSEWAPARLGERAAAMCDKWGIHRPNLVVDNARGLQGNDVMEEIRATGKFWSAQLPRKGRRAERHALMASMLTAAAERDTTRPHLYVADTCGFLIHAIANSVRDERDPDDVADTPGCPDHPLDSAQYAIAHMRIRRTTSGRVTGLH